MPNSCFCKRLQKEKDAGVQNWRQLTVHENRKALALEKTTGQSRNEWDAAVNEASIVITPSLKIHDAFFGLSREGPV
ncbi:Guanine nucleotide-binding protein G(f) subunit alpha [Clarias magur]|uniref:Guanine nucleotide-binding protein G(F) subunit alpha n=1 Tax=Clarias magur TaxID=1594786 RepID=A0A8J4TCF4_CLAMG|nr:Guanine nucleotide-binding protein G(f) subunit alpha [Clarias magur]